MKSNIQEKINTATKWSIITEIIAKIFGPVSSIILARLLTPEAYGVVATVTMVIAFSNLFADAGFQKYLLQATFTNTKEKFKAADVAFWTNLIISVSFFVFIYMFRFSLCKYLGNPGLELALTIACLSIPISSFSSLQNALFKRNLDFKTLFNARVISLVIPLFITIPLAFYTRSYWALIIGNLALSFIKAIFLYIKSDWKPSFYFNMTKLKEMFSFGIWVTFESILSWVSNYLDIFLIGIYLSPFYLGLYKTSTVLVAQVFTLITSAVIPVLTPSLSKFKRDRVSFDNLFFKYQKLLSIVSIPLGVIVYLNSKLITTTILGPQWIEGADFIGIWALMYGFSLLFIQFKSAALIAMGKPKYLVFGQIFYILIFVPIIIISVKNGFKTLYISRTLIRLVPIATSIFFLTYIIKMDAWRLLTNIFPALFSSFMMGLVLFVSNYYFGTSVLLLLINIFLSSIVYIVLIMLFKAEKLYIKHILINEVYHKIKIWK
ncbi:MAG: O-antigen/teichoic acid export membrane protein [Flavobacteriaceae bacterium]